MISRRYFITALVGSCLFPRLAISQPSYHSRNGLQKVNKSAHEWRMVLMQDEFYVLREHGTEKAFSSPLNNEYRPGVYHCAGCNTALFTSAMKYDSGSGWPSFFTCIEGHLETKKDNSLFYTRTEYHCACCGGHQGHVFDDGPQPTGQRWCNNGTALKFVPTSSI